MKILSVTTALPKNDAEYTRILNISHYLEKNGIEVDIIHYIIKGSYNYNKYQKGSFPGNFIVDNPLFLFFHHINVLRKNDYDFVYGNTFIATFFCILGKLVLRKPLILDMHGISEESNFFENSKFFKKSFLFRFLNSLSEKITLKFADKILCVSYEMIEYLHKKKKVPRNKMFYVPNGVDLDFFNKRNVNSLKEKYKLQNKFVFGYIGGTHKWQGFENFIEASKKINNDNFVAIVVGIDVSRYNIEYNKKNIIFIPWVNKCEIVSYYSICDVLVLPRPKHVVTQVAAPTKFAEYTSMGKPVLVSDVGDAANFVRKYKNGIVVENNSITNLKNGIIQFLSMSPDNIDQMAQNSRNLAQNEFDSNKVYNNLIELLKSD